MIRSRLPMRLFSSAEEMQNIILFEECARRLVRIQLTALDGRAKFNSIIKLNKIHLFLWSYKFPLRFLRKNFRKNQFWFKKTQKPILCASLYCIFRFLQRTLNKCALHTVINVSSKFKSFLLLIVILILLLSRMREFIVIAFCVCLYLCVCLCVTSLSFCIIFVTFFAFPTANKSTCKILVTFICNFLKTLILLPHFFVAAVDQYSSIIPRYIMLGEFADKVVIVTGRGWKGDFAIQTLMILM